MRQAILVNGKNGKDETRIEGQSVEMLKKQIESAYKERLY